MCMYEVVKGYPKCRRRVKITCQVASVGDKAMMLHQVNSFMSPFYEHIFTIIHCGM